MPVCEKHPEQFLKQGQECNKCLWLKHDKQKREDKIKVYNSKKIIKFGKANERTKLKLKLQSLVSARAKKLYKDKGFYYCWIDGIKNDRSGLFGLHVSHYFAKSDIWQLWDDPVNIGLSSYSRNVNRPETVALMRSMMVKVWGEEAVKDLEARADFYKNRINVGIDPKYPPDIWLIGKIEELKKK